jgi:hypothetical protein
MRNALWISGVLLLSAAATAPAQDAFRFGYPWGAGYHHASTFEEGVQRGFADVVRSRGMKNVMDSEAAINWEEARKRYMDNRVYGTQKYFEMREINRQARAAERGPRPTMQDLIRYSEVRKPDRLEASQLDPLIGTITWPAALRSDDFKADRLALEELYSQRAAEGYLNGEQMTQVKNIMQSMDGMLKTKVKSLPNIAYVEAKSFLKSLSYESLLASG